MAAAGRAVTYIELTLDFEVFTGLDLQLPTTRNRVASASPLAERSLAFCNILRVLVPHTAPQRLFPGERIKCCNSLAALGISRTAGISRRPLFLGGVEIDRLILSLSASASSASASSSSSSGPFSWAHQFIPDHQPAGRAAKAAVYMAKAASSSSTSEALSSAKRTRAQPAHARHPPRPLVPLLPSPAPASPALPARRLLDLPKAKRARSMAPAPCSDPSVVTDLHGSLHNPVGIKRPSPNNDTHHQPALKRQRHGRGLPEAYQT